MTDDIFTAESDGEKNVENRSKFFGVIMDHSRKDPGVLFLTHGRHIPNYHRSRSNMIRLVLSASQSIMRV